jgi:hypothetical protein
MPSIYSMVAARQGGGQLSSGSSEDCKNLLCSHRASSRNSGKKPVLALPTAVTTSRQQQHMNVKLILMINGLVAAQQVHSGPLSCKKPAKNLL